MDTTPSRRRAGRRLAAFLLAAACVTAVAAPALAQQAPGLRPPTPDRAENVPLTSYLAVLIVIVLPLLVNFVSSKRGHQD